MITFDAERHRYTDNGVNIPSVTTILGAVGLPNLSMVGKEDLKRAAERGTAVHSATEFDDEGELDESSLSEEISMYLEGYRRFKSESGFEIIEIEKRIYHPVLKYAGTLDRYGILNGKRVVLDIKSGVFDPLSVGPQTAAYAEAYTDLKCYRYALQLKDDGTYKLHKLTNSNDFNIFLSALNIWKWRNQK